MNSSRRCVVPALLALIPLSSSWAQSPLLGEVHVMLPSFLDDTRAAALGDVDGDGDLDAVLANGGGQQNRLFRNDGIGVFFDATPLLPPDADDTRAVAAGDVDGDGDFDLLFGNSFQQNRLHLGDGTGSFADATGQLPADMDVTTALALGDVDGDGDPDLLLGNDFGLPSRLYRNGGTGVFSDATGQLPGDAGPTVSVALADVDGDGDLDALIGEGAFLGSFLFGVQDRLYFNGGAGVFSDATGLLPGDAHLTSSIAPGDVDGDGDLDLLLGSDDLLTGINLQNRLYLNLGGGAFADASGQLPPDAEATRAVALDDLDDAELDFEWADDERVQEASAVGGGGREGAAARNAGEAGGAMPDDALPNGGAPAPMDVEAETPTPVGADRDEDGVWRRPGTAGSYESLDDIAGHMPFIGDGSPAVDINGQAKLGFPTPSKKLELFSETSRQAPCELSEWTIDSFKCWILQLTVVIDRGLLHVV